MAAVPAGQEAHREERRPEAEQVPQDLKVNSTTCTATDLTMEAVLRPPPPAPSPAGAVEYSSISPSSKHNLTLAATPPARYRSRTVSTLDIQTLRTRTPTAHRSGITLRPVNHIQTHPTQPVGNRLQLLASDLCLRTSLRHHHQRTPVVAAAPAMQPAAIAPHRQRHRRRARCTKPSSKPSTTPPIRFRSCWSTTNRSTIPNSHRRSRRRHTTFGKRRRRSVHRHVRTRQTRRHVDLSRVPPTRRPPTSCTFTIPFIPLPRHTRHIPSSRRRRSNSSRFRRGNGTRHLLAHVG